jgi:hypothetical protein
MGQAAEIELWPVLQKVCIYIILCVCACVYEYTCVYVCMKILAGKYLREAMQVLVLSLLH